MPARSTGKFILSMNARPTPSRCSPSQVAEACHALQLRASDADIKSLAGSIVGSALVAIVQNMAANDGTFQAIELDASPLTETVERPVTYRPGGAIRGQ